MALSIPGLLMLLAPVALAAVMLASIELIVWIEMRRERLQTRTTARRRQGPGIPANDALARSPWDFEGRRPEPGSMTWIEDAKPGRGPRAGTRF